MFLKKSKSLNYEGLMLKASSSIYKPLTRIFWGKVKYANELGLETLDLVPIGAYWGKGRRGHFYGAYLLACYDPETEKYIAICKIGTGFDDKFLEE